MKKWAVNNIILIALLIAGIIASTVIIVGRTGVEAKGMTYDLVLDYSDLVKMVDQSDEDMEYWLRFLFSNGVDKLAVQEYSLSSLADASDGRVYVTPSSTLRSRFGWDKLYPEEVVSMGDSFLDDKDVLVAVTDADLYEAVLNGLEERADGLVWDSVSVDGVGYLWLHGSAKTAGTAWVKMPLGMDTEIVSLAQSIGYTVIPRSTVQKGTNSAVFGEALLRDMREYGSPYFIAAGESIPGYENNPSAASELIDYLEETNAAYALIEDSKQRLNIEVKGMDEVVEASGYNAVRAFSMWQYIQNSYAKYNYTGPEEITNALFRAVSERNCRIIYLKAILQAESTTDYVTEPEAYSKLLGDLYVRLADIGYTHETVTPTPEFDPGLTLRIVLGLGAVAAAVMLLELLVPISAVVKYVFLALGCVGVAGAFYVAPNTSKLLLSLGSGIVLPSLICVALLRYLSGTGTELSKNRRFSKILVESIAVSAVAALLSLGAALYTTCALSESSFMLEMELYRGVKVMQLIPIALFFAAYLLIFLWEKHFGRLFSGNRSKINKKLRLIMDRTVYVRHLVICAAALLVLAVLAVIGFYYIDRTGNSENVSDTELIFRNFLENTLVARPRTKEFLVGWPCLMLLCWSLRRRIPVLPFIFGAGAVAGGFVSVVNTFLHIRTSIVTSLVRTFTGFGFGFVIGVAAILAAEGIYHLAIRRKQND